MSKKIMKLTFQRLLPGLETHYKVQHINLAYKTFHSCQSSSNTLHSKCLEENITQVNEKNGIGFDHAFIIRQCYHY